ncbi:alpha/beta fold hydrolase [Streptomyces cadmiisoli]|uniref:alpha/beta fold hydrolase n=1 Tax=Streptomyces cadmiisoli TaxID=2184053 RepID=UPI003656BF4C
MPGTPQSFLAGLAAEVQDGPVGRSEFVFLHGLTFDRRHWHPVLDELRAGGEEHRTLALDLPGHGGSPRWPAHQLRDVTEAVHRAAVEAGFGRPVVVGHSIGGVLATLYAATHPAAGVVNIDQPLLAGPFAEMLRRNEQVLRSEDCLRVWDELISTMGVEQLAPAARELVASADTPRQDLLLGYWSELMTASPSDLTTRREEDLRAISAAGLPYLHVSGRQVPPGYRAWLKKALPEAGIAVVPSHSHFPHLTHPAELAALISRMPGAR